MSHRFHRTPGHALVGVTSVLAVLAVVLALAPATASAEGANTISAGVSHTCALLDDGAVRCWGAGTSGRLGYGNTSSIGDDETPGSVGPVDLGPGRTAVALSAGQQHTCAVLDDGTVRCWGDGANGRLGYGNTNSIGDNEVPGSVSPVDLGAGRTATAIATGGWHTCALLDDGAVRCWGDGTSGQLGYGNANTIGDDETPGSVAPVDLGPGRTAVAISAGGAHTCAVLDDDTVRCWGDGANGRLGYGNTNSIGDNETPGSVGPVDLGAGRTATAIAAGGWVSDAHTCVVLDDGAVRCWGSGGSGRLGYGNTNTIGDSEAPGSVGPVGLGAGRTAVAITAGNGHTCAVLDDDTVRCWGRGDDGRLGYGNTNTIGDGEMPRSIGPVDLGAGRTAVAVSAGWVHTCTLLDDDTVRCWGFGSNGRLGYGNTSSIGDNETPGSVGPVDLGAGRTATAISVGDEHTCAVLDNGAVRCWGTGGNGRLGYGNTNTIGDNELPGTVGPVDLGVGRTAVAIAAGGLHTCAVLDNGTVRCWGGGGNGRLGYGNTNTIGDNETPGSVGPVDLGPGRTAVAVTAGDSHTCALLDDDTVRCWGAGDVGQLGYGNTSSIGDNETPGSAGPVDLGAGRTAVAASVGHQHTCAVLDDGAIRCWGNGTDGQLGYGNQNTIGDDETPGSAGPVDLGPGRTAVAIAGARFHTCAVLDDGTTRCWGDGTNGQLGYGNTGFAGSHEMPGFVGPVDLGFVDDPPTADDDTSDVVEDDPATAIDVLTNDTDTDGGPKSIASVTQPDDGTVVITGGGTGLTYEPDADYCNSQPGTGPDGFTYTLAPGGSTAPVEIEVACVDDLPSAGDDAADVVEDDPATAIDVLTNDTDIDGGPKSIASVTQPAGGEVVIIGGGTSLTYRPSLDYCNDPPGATPDDFTYELNGGSTATVSVTVACADELVDPDDPGPGTPEPSGSPPSTSKSANPAAPAPIAGESVLVEPAKGIAEIKCPGDGGFAPLESIERIPIGCEVDVSNGEIVLTSAKRGGGTQTGRFWDGIFRISQGPDGEIVLTLTGPLNCGTSGGRGKSGPQRGRKPKRGRARKAGVSAEASRKGGRKLWGSGKGNFRTVGKYGSATVRGTTWLVEDRCDKSTLFQVREGVVSVRDFAKRKSLPLRKGKRYVATGKRGRR